MIVPHFPEGGMFQQCELPEEQQLLLLSQLDCQTDPKPPMVSPFTGHQHQSTSKKFLACHLVIHTIYPGLGTSVFNTSTQDPGLMLFYIHHDIPMKSRSLLILKSESHRKQLSSHKLVYNSIQL